MYLYELHVKKLCKIYVIFFKGEGGAEVEKGVNPVNLVDRKYS